MASSCPFFDKLPAEMRNQIYELAFGPDDEETPVSLHCMKPPEKGIAVTCRRGWTEARQYYIDAFHRYWRNTKFYFNQDIEQSFKRTLHVFHAVDIDRISSLTIKRKQRHHETTLELIDRRGLWEVSLESVVPVGGGVGRRTQQKWCVVCAFVIKEQRMRVFWVPTDERKDALMRLEMELQPISKQLSTLREEYNLDMRMLWVRQTKR